MYKYIYISVAGGEVSNKGWRPKRNPSIFIIEFYSSLFFFFLQIRRYHKIFRYFKNLILDFFESILKTEWIINSLWLLHVIVFIDENDP